MSLSYHGDYTYAIRSLEGSIVKYNNEPVQVTGGHNDYVHVYIYSLLTGDKSKVKLSDLDLSPIEIGYVNDGRNAEYWTRIPSRQWRQGLSSRNLRRGNSTVRIDRRLVKTVKGEFPTFEMALESIKYGSTSIAFHRQWAVGFDKPNRYTLMYRSKVVGKFDPENKDRLFQSINWINNRSYLKECLEKALKK